MVGTLAPIQVAGSPEIAIVLLLVALLFGADRIPKLARSTGRAIGEFQRGRREAEGDADDGERSEATTRDETDGDA